MGKEYLISDFAKMFNITKRTLQYYDKIGLLKPAYIKENGYRVYGEHELGKLIEILIWKNIGFESDDIKHVFEDKSPSNIEKTIDKIEDDLEAELQRILFLKNNIKSIKKGLNQHSNISNSKIMIKSLEHRSILSLSSSGVKLTDLDEMMAEGTEILRETISYKIPFIEFGFMFKNNGPVPKDYTIYDAYYFVLPEGYEEHGNHVYPKGKYVCTLYEGKIEGITDKVKEVLHWMGKHSYIPIGDVIYSESFNALYSDDYGYTLGEVQILIEKIE